MAIVKELPISASVLAIFSQNHPPGFILGLRLGLYAGIALWRTSDSWRREQQTNIFFPEKHWKAYNPKAYKYKKIFKQNYKRIKSCELS